MRVNGDSTERLREGDKSDFRRFYRIQEEED